MIPRIRTVKPELFRHEGLFDAERETGLPLRLAFVGLLTCCDREGRFPWRPRTLKTAVLPFDEVDFAKILDSLMDHDFIGRYSAAGEEFGYVPTFKKHQVINNRERESEIPPPPDESESHNSTSRDRDASSTREAGVSNALGMEGSPAKHGQSQSLCSAQVEGKGIRNGKTVSDETRTGVRPESFFDSWNRLSGPLAKLRDFTEGRRRKVKARIGQGLTLDRFEEAVRKCAATPFLCGDSARGWKCDFDWLIENDTHIAAVLEGKYDSNQRSIAPLRDVPSSESFRDTARDAEQRAIAEAEAFDLAHRNEPGFQAWKDILKRLETVIMRQSFETWLKPTRYSHCSGNTMFVRIPGVEFEHIGAKYSEQIKAAAMALGAKFTEFRFITPQATVEADEVEAVA